MVAIARRSGPEIDVRRIVVALMVGPGARFSDRDCERGLGILDERWNEPALLLRCHGVREEVGHFPALVHDHREAEIPGGKLFADDAQRENVDARPAMLLGHTEGAKPKLVRRADPVPRYALRRGRQTIPAQYVGPDDFPGKLPGDLAPAPLLLRECEIHRILLQAQCFVTGHASSAALNPWRDRGCRPWA